MSIELTEEQKAMAEGLTKLQYKVVVNVISGMTQRQAYIAAGGTAKSENTQDASASELLSNPKVKAFYDSVMNTITENVIITKEEIIKGLAEDFRDPGAEGYKCSHSAAKIINDMIGYNAPKKQELSGDLAITEVVRKVVD